MTQAKKRQEAEPAPSVDEVLREGFRAVEAKGVPDSLREQIDVLTKPESRADSRS